MRIDQPRQHQSSAKIHHLRRGAHQWRHICITADREDGIAGESDRLLNGARRVGRVDLAVPEDNICLPILCGLRGGKR